MDKQTNSTTQKIIRLTAADGKVTWMLFTEDRKVLNSSTLIREGDESSALYGDEVNIQLRMLGSFDWRIHPFNNSFQSCGNGNVVMKMRGQASGGSQASVHFSDGYIVVENPWKGLRIGTYMMNHLVAWAKENYPDSRPVGIRLSSLQALDEESRASRNKFYKRFEFKFKWDEGKEQIEGHLDPDLRIRDLETTQKWNERIAEFSVEEGTKLIFSEYDRLSLECLNSQNRVQSANEGRLRALDEAERCRTGRTRWGLFGFVLGAILMALASVLK